MNPESVTRQVISAKWYKITKLYGVILNCGHGIECSEAMLSSKMICLECYKDTLKSQKDKNG
jgi:hypothetical protein